MEERHVLNAAQQSVMENIVNNALLEFVAISAAAMGLDMSEWSFDIGERAFKRKTHVSVDAPAPQASPEL